MTLSVTHAKVSGKPASSNPALVGGPEWDAAHSLTGLLSSTQLDLTMSPTWTGSHVHTYAPTISGNGSSNSPLWITTTPTGTANSGTVLSLAQGNVQPKIYFNFPADTVNAAAIGGNPVDVPGLVLHQTLGGASQIGSRSVLSINTEVTSNLASPSNNSFYPNIENTTSISANCGGTNTGLGSIGSFYSYGGQLTAQSGATNLAALIGAEFDISCQTGSSVRTKIGCLVTSFNSDAVQGAAVDAGYMLNTGPVGGSFKVGLQFGDGTYNPIASTGTVIGSGSAGGNVGKGIDFSAYTFATAGILLSASGKIGISTATPTGPLSFGTSFIGTAGQANIIQLYDTGSAASSYGIGLSSGQLNIASGGSLGFYITSGTLALGIDTVGNVICNNAGISTSATDGFLYIATCAGTPTGVPTSYSGRVPIVFDITNNKLYIYHGGWKGGTVPGAFS